MANRIFAEKELTAQFTECALDFVILHTFIQLEAQLVAKITNSYS